MLNSVAERIEDMLQTKLLTGNGSALDLSVFEEMNLSMNSLSVPFMVNRSTIEAYWNDLEQVRNKSCNLYWLLTARLTELTLLCAGQYADCGEFHCARDLLYSLTDNTAGLFPFFYRFLQKSERVSRTYVIGLRMRWGAVVRMLRFLCSYGVEKAEDFWQKYMDASSGDRHVIKNNLCCFDRDLFEEMGVDVTRIIENPDYQSSFLR